MSNDCGSCTQCCKEMGITADDGTTISEPGSWCTHCEIGVGCQIYEQRPKSCRTFDCVWLISQRTKKPLPLELRPDKSRVVLAGTPTELTVIVDRHRPDAFKRGLMGHYLAQVSQKVHTWLMIGDQEGPLGPIAMAKYKKDHNLP